MSVGAKVWRGTVFVSGANVLARLGSFGANLVIIRYLGKDLVGELGLIEVWVGLATMLSLLGIGLAATKQIAQHLEDNPSRVWSIAVAALLLGSASSLGVGIVVYIGLTFEPFQIANAAYKALSNHSFLVIGLIVFTSIKEIVVAIVYGQQMFPVLLKTNLVIGLSSFPISLFLVHHFGLSGALGARLVLIVIEAILLLSLLFFAARPAIRFSWVSLRNDSQHLLSFGLVAFVGQLASSPVQTFLISTLAAQPGGLAQIGLYTTANRMTSLAGFLPASMASTLIPVLSNEWAKGDAEGFRAATLQALRMFWLISLPVVVFFLTASPTLLGWLYGSEFRNAWPIACALLLVILLSSLNETADRALAATGHIWLSSFNNYIGAGMTLFFALILIPHYGSLGYVGGLLVAFVFYLSLQLGQLRHLFSIALRPLFVLTLFSIVMVILALLVTVITKSYSVIQFGLAIVLSIFTLWVEKQVFLDEQEKNLVSKVWKNAFDNGSASIKALFVRSSS